MSNRIDFFQSAQTQLSLPSAAVSIFLDGSLCSYLEPVEIVRCGWPEFGRAGFRFNRAAYPQAQAAAIEDIETVVPIGKSICVRQIYNGASPSVSVCSLTLFAGQIEGIETRLDDGGESVEVTARDFSAELERVTVYGQRLRNPDGSIVFLAGADTIFNAKGKAGAVTEPAELNGYSYTVFCAEPSQARPFSYAEAINYLLCEYLPAGRLHTPDIEQLRALTEEQVVRDLDVTGLNLLEALYRCCEHTGLRFRFVGRLSSTGPQQAIVFYRPGYGRTVELNCQPAGEQLSISATNISRLHSRKNFWPVTHRHIGRGDFKVYEATFDLVRVWDSSLEDTDYDRFSPSTNPDFYQVKDVYRKWCLNEAGDYSGQPYNRGDVFDFSKIFGSGNFACRRRRFQPTLTTDKNRKSLGYFLQVSLDDGEHWWQYLYAFNNLLDECGVWLSSDQFDVQTWIAALKGVLKFRITASVVSDERLSCTVADGPVDSTAAVVDNVMTLPRRFSYRRVSNRSIFYGSSDESLGIPDEADDTERLYEFVRKKAGGASGVIETVDLQTPQLAPHYQVGDRVAGSAESRDLLGVRADNRSRAWIERVRMDFAKQCTDLKVVRKRGLF